MRNWNLSVLASEPLSKSCADEVTKLVTMKLTLRVVVHRNNVIIAGNPKHELEFN